MKNATLEKRIDEYLAYRRSLGFRLTFHEWTLRSFARFAATHGYRGLLKRGWIEEFTFAPRTVHTGYYKARRRVLLDFAGHWAAHDPRVEVPVVCNRLSGYRRRQPFIYSDEQIQSLMRAARSALPDEAIVGETHATAIGLMACSGLRTGEAVNLRKGDVDLDQQLLRVRNSKDRPLRLVPLHDTTATALRAYARRRDVRFAQVTTDHFFLNKWGSPFTQKAMQAGFVRIRDRAGIAAPAGRRQPRAYDLRHTFACNCLLRWLRAGRDVSRSIHLLATYLGHDGVRETYWYLSGVPELFELVGRRFERFASGSTKGGRR